MSDMMGIALSGLRAAEGMATVAASNLVNAQSGASAPAASTAYAGYVPRTADAVAQAGGGVDLVSRPVEPSYVLLPAGEGGNVAMPNVDPVVEIATLNSAERSYQTSASLIRTADAMQRTMLDAFG